MRRKVIQYFANMFPQRFLDLPSGYDLAVLAKAERGRALFDFLGGTSSIDGTSQPNLRTGASYRDWLLKEAASHGIDAGALVHASMEVAFEVTGIEIKESFGHVSHSATFTFQCASEVRTDERSYSCQSVGTKSWGYGWYWEQLFGVPGQGA